MYTAEMHSWQSQGPHRLEACRSGELEVYGQPSKPQKSPLGTQKPHFEPPARDTARIGARMQSVRKGSSGSHSPQPPQNYRSAQYARRRALGGFGKEMA